MEDPIRLEKSLEKISHGFSVNSVDALLGPRRSSPTLTKSMRQALATDFFWVTWLQHDVANVAVYLPRKLSLVMMLCVVGYLFVILVFFVSARWKYSTCR